MKPTSVQVAPAPADQTSPPDYTPSASQPTYHTSQPTPGPQYPPPPGPYHTLPGAAYPGPAYYPPPPPAQPAVAAPIINNNMNMMQNNNNPAAASVVVVERESRRPSRDMGCPILFACLTIWFLGNYLFGLAGFIIASKCDILPRHSRVMLCFLLFPYILFTSYRKKLHVRSYIRRIAFIRIHDLFLSELTQPDI